MAQCRHGSLWCPAVCGAYTDSHGDRLGAMILVAILEPVQQNREGGCKRVSTHGNWQSCVGFISIYRISKRFS